MQRIKYYCEVRDYYHYAGYIEMLQIAYPTENVMYLKQLLQFFIIDLTLIIIFFIKELAEEFEKKLCNLYNANKKIATSIDKNKEQITKNMSYRLQLIDSATDLWQTYNQILLIIFLKEFIKLSVNCGIKYKYCDCFLEHAKLSQVAL